MMHDPTFVPDVPFYPYQYIGGGRAITRCKNGNYLIYDLNDRSVGLHLLLRGEHEPAMDRLLAGYKFPGRTHIVVGSNYGYFDVSIAKQQEDAYLYSIEANPALIPYLTWNMEINGLLNERLTILPTAVSDTDGRMKLHTLTRHHGSGSLFMLHEHLALDSEHASVEVSCIKLDTLFIDEPRKIGILKIDAEMSEGMVIRGGLRLIEKNPPAVIICEYMRKADASYVNVLVAAGYEASIMFDDGKRLEIESEHDLRNFAAGELIFEAKS